MKFTFNSRILRHLGYELITSDEIAITELIKNSYDAKASLINIRFFSSINSIYKNEIYKRIPSLVIEEIKKINVNGIVLIEDDGKGMDYLALQNGFFEVGGTLKKQEKEFQDAQSDIILGEKGIGRLAAQRISPILIVETAIKGSTNVNIVKVKWDDFIADKDAEAPEWKIKRDGEVSYTRLWLIGNEDQKINFNSFFEEKENFEIDLFGNPGKSLGRFFYIRENLQSALSFLYSPFEEKKSVINLNLEFDNYPIIYDFNYEIIKLAESVHTLQTELQLDNTGQPIDLLIKLGMQIKPWFVERVHLSELGKVLYQDWKRSHTEYKKLIDKYKEQYSKSLNESFLLSDIFKKWSKKHQGKMSSRFIQSILDLSPMEGKIFSFKRDKALISMAIESAIENNYLSSSSEIKTDFSEFLSAHNGIKLYRNSFRIGTIGNKDNDWLKLQQKRTTGQQFYRFELGNVIGFIKINDKKQEHIYETSSRENLTENSHVNALQIALSEIIEIFSPGFNKKAVEITKHILDLERMIPENTGEQIESELEKSKTLLAAAKKNIQAIKVAINVIKDNIDLNTDEKIQSVKTIFKELEPVALNFEQNIEETSRSFKSANTLLEVAKQQQIRIKTEAYNNYKLMANGLVTEVITHELHSLLSNSDTQTIEFEKHFETLEEYFLNNELYEINKMHLLPIKSKFNHLFNRMSDLDKFYSFLEKTFLYKGTSEDLIPVNVQEELKEITERFSFRLQRHKIDIKFDSVSNVWEVPKGSLLHVFYNLIDNAIYWIRERQRLSRTIPVYKREAKDEIVVRTINQGVIHLFDSGTGVLEKYQHTLFNEMESGKENGRGMGLYIVRQFLKSFGGEIELLNSVNEYGNRFIFEIRMKNNQDEQERSA